MEDIVDSNQFDADGNACGATLPYLMKLLSLNVWGLENPQGFKSLCDLIRREDPDVVLLQEMKVRLAYFSFKKFSLGFENALAVVCEGQSSGLTILWKQGG